MAWKIVEFGGLCRSGTVSGCNLTSTATKSASIVPERWIFIKGGSNFTYWPPKSSLSVSNLVKKMSVPHADWEIWSLTHISKETIDNFEEAREMLNGVSEVTDIDEHISKRRGKEYGKGKRSPKKKAYGSGENENMQRDSVLSDLPEDSDEEINEPHVMSHQKKRAHYIQKGTRILEASNNNQQTVTSRDAACQTSSHARQPDNSQNSSKLDKIVRSIVDIERTISKLCSKLVSVELVVRELVVNVDSGFNKMSVVAQAAEPVALPFILPLSDSVKFHEAMAEVQKPEIMEQILNDLSRVGGKDETALVNGILCRLMTNSFARLCSWKGQRGGKYTLDSTPFLKLVHGAAIRNTGFGSMTEEVVKDRIQKWLKQASRRKTAAARTLAEEPMIVQENEGSDADGSAAQDWMQWVEVQE